MRVLISLALGLWPGAAPAQTVECGNGVVSVQTEVPGLAAQICAATDRGLQLFAQCSIPAPAPVTIQTVESLASGCVALYHCGEARIEILAPDKLEASTTEVGLFSAIPTASFFDAVIVHELTHAALDDVRCPFEDCRATGEYVAYNMQIMSLSDADRTTIEEQILMNQKVAFDEISALMYFLAPNRFAAKAWAHLNQRPDACSYIAQIVAGDIHFEKVHP